MDAWEKIKAVLYIGAVIYVTIILYSLVQGRPPIVPCPIGGLMQLGNFSGCSLPVWP